MKLYDVQSTRTKRVEPRTEQNGGEKKEESKMDRRFGVKQEIIEDSRSSGVMATRTP